MSLIFYSSIAYVLTTPRPSDQFFQLYVLGSNKTLTNYYPNNTPNISPNTTVNWYIGVTNYMGSAQIVCVKVKLSNSTIAPPNSTSAIPSNSPVIADFCSILPNNTTWEFPFSWKIIKVDKIADSAYLTLSVNEEKLAKVTEVSAKRGMNFRIIIELWTFDLNSEKFIFGWTTNGKKEAAWTQIWFNATQT
ncbi:MAG: hypothetical protein ACP5IZ_09890 [Thermoprotei archaeon]